MLSCVMATRFDRVLSSGKTRPCLVGCTGNDGSEVELVVKFAAGCEMGHRSLMTEAIAAMLAADLDLPVPEPFQVQVDPDFIAIIPDPTIRGLAQRSLGWNFGSKKLPPGFITYPIDKPVPQPLMSVAAEILAFDTFIVNPDRECQIPTYCSTAENSLFMIMRWLF